MDELKKQLEEVTRERDKYRLIADFTNDFEYWMDPKGQFEYISPGCRNVSGYATESFYRDPDLFYRIVHHEDREYFRAHIAKLLDLTVIDENISFRIVTRSKLLKYCELTSKSVYNLLGKYLGQRGSIRDITKLIEFSQQVREITDKQQSEEQEKNLFKLKAEQVDRELTTSLMQMSQKNELLQHISKRLEIVKDTHPGMAKDLQSRIRQEINSGGQWEEFKVHFENSHPGFFERLSNKYPKLTSKDLKLCAYIRIQLSTKEIASLLNITPKSAEISRVRLRKKLNMQRREDLGALLSRL